MKDGNNTQRTFTIKARSQTEMWNKMLMEEYERALTDLKSGQVI